MATSRPASSKPTAPPMPTPKPSANCVFLVFVAFLAALAASVAGSLKPWIMSAPDSTATVTSAACTPSTVTPCACNALTKRRKAELAGLFNWLASCAVACCGLVPLPYWRSEYTAMAGASSLRRREVEVTLRPSTVRVVCGGSRLASPLVKAVEKVFVALLDPLAAGGTSHTETVTRSRVRAVNSSACWGSRSRPGGLGG
ncbi:hypothetical protein V8C86DRAFT_2587780 [Haematococcus lacustris]